ncbi:hypothetical protein BOO22_04665 [Vibrio cidicii]|uniref:hypothetical protein n=1 Tax=Vibrio cidicii TaxID=1763883 RepID=UPI0018C2DAB4|nr:hypothetical protein [Vibrio cidicii]MBG0758701.1 hypothetical protein [Vibrio cidicii]
MAISSRIAKLGQASTLNMLNGVPHRYCPLCYNTLIPFSTACCADCACAMDATNPEPLKARILLSSGTESLYLQSFLKGHVVTTTHHVHALTLPENTARQLLNKIKSRWPVAQLSYSIKGA